MLPRSLARTLNYIAAGSWNAIRIPSEEVEFTMTESRTGEHSVQDMSQADIDSLGTKLAGWADTLSGVERSIVQQLVERTRALTPANLAVGRLADDLTASALALIKKLNLNASPVAWVRTGPVWQQTNPQYASEYNYGEEITLIQRVNVTIRPTG
jgi:hypothetical protein